MADKVPVTIHLDPHIYCIKKSERANQPLTHIFTVGTIQRCVDCGYLWPKRDL